MERAGACDAKLHIVDDVPVAEQFRTAVPVHDLAAAAGAFSEGQAPEVIGWARLQHAQHALDKRTFVAKVAGRSMEPAIPDGCWALFRLFPDGVPPAATALDGMRVVVQLRETGDPEHGGRYTLKRWRVGKTDKEGGVQEVQLRPDNPSFATLHMRPDNGEIRAIAEFLEVLAVA